MKRFLFAHVAAATVMLFATTSARAGLVPVDQAQWSYNFTPAAAAVFADGNPSADVAFTNETTHSAVGNSTVVLTNLRVSSTADPGHPDLLTHNGSYSISMVLGTSANGSPMSGTLTFKGKLGGSFSASSSNVTNKFDPLFSSQTLTLGAYTFTVSLLPFTPPGPPGSTNAGSVAAFVSLSGGPHITSVPEPSSMLLSGLGLTFLGGAAWRKRRLARLAV
jgi:hypothetical protein